jgi:hypothetical protein
MQRSILFVLLTLLFAAVPERAQDSASNYFKRGNE